MAKRRIFNAPSGSGVVVSVATGVAVDSSGNAYITRYNDPHPVLAKYSSAGALLWETYLPSALEPPGDMYPPALVGAPTGITVSTNGESIFVVGDTLLKLNEPGSTYTPVSANTTSGATTDVYVMAFNGAGTRQWIRTLSATTTTKCPQNTNGTAVCGFSSQAVGVTATPNGSAVYVTGLTFGALLGHSNQGSAKRLRQ